MFCTYLLCSFDSYCLLTPLFFCLVFAWITCPFVRVGKWTLSLLMCEVMCMACLFIHSCIHSFTLHSNLTPPQSPSCSLHTDPPPITIHFFSEKREPPSRYHPTLQVSAVLDTSCPNETKRSSPVRGTVSKNREMIQLLGNSHEDHVAYLLQVCWGFSLWKTIRVQFSWPCWSPCGIPVLFGSLNSSPNSSSRLPKSI